MARKLSLLAAACLSLALPELVYWLAARAAPPLPGPGDCSVLVLGFPTNADGSPSAVQRARVETGVEVFKAQRCRLLALAGGNPHSPYVEAGTMADVAEELGVPRTRMFLEGRSRDTWENIAFTLPQLEVDRRVYLVSDPLHVWRARRYWCRQRPDLCPRALVATRYRSFELYGMKWLGLLGELAASVKDAFKGPETGPPASRP